MFTVNDWQLLLDRWEVILNGAGPYLDYFWGIDSSDRRERNPPRIVRRKGASDSDIKALEQRLGLPLPPSYRTFLQVTDGCEALGFPVEVLYECSRVDWFRVLNPDWLAEDLSAGVDTYPPIPDEMYFVYGNRQNVEDIRIEYEAAALQVSDLAVPYEDEVYLLNPMVVTPDGEWEAWARSIQALGAFRYRSFYEMMEARIETFDDGMKNY